jgi:hypothetical protein
VIEALVLVLVLAAWIAVAAFLAVVVYEKRNRRDR